MTALCSSTRPRIDQRETEEERGGRKYSDYFYSRLLLFFHGIVMWHFHGDGGTVCLFDMDYSGSIVCTHSTACIHAGIIRPHK